MANSNNCGDNGFLFILLGGGDNDIIRNLDRMYYQPDPFYSYLGSLSLCFTVTG